jgi:hypothetical protein
MELTPGERPLGIAIASPDPRDGSSRLTPESS